MKRVMVVALVLLCVTGTVFATGAVETTQQVYKLRSSTNLAPGGTVGRGLQYFVDELNKAAGGRIEATANFGSELGTQREQVEMTKTGSLEMVVSAPGTGPGAYIPQLQAIDLPYLFNDEEHFVRVLNGVEAEMSRLLAPHNFVAIGGQNMGFRHMLIKQRPVSKPADLQGLKMRGPNPVFVQMFQALGASGVTTDWNDVYTSLQTGVVDGQMNPLSIIAMAKFQEVQKYITLTNHLYAPYVWVINPRFYSSLPADLQRVVDDASRTAILAGRGLSRIIDASDKGLPTLAARMEVYVPNTSEMRQFRDVTMPAAKAFMTDKYKAEGTQWVDRFYSAIEAAEKELGLR